MKISKLTAKQKDLGIAAISVLLVGVIAVSLIYPFAPGRDKALGANQITEIEMPEDEQGLTDWIDGTMYIDLARISALKAQAAISTSINRIFAEQTGVLLNVPLILQIYPLSCEAATLQMILQYRGIVKSQDELMQDIGLALPSVPEQNGNVVIWGDPDVGFVGDYKGKFAVARNGKLEGDGWGVNEGPVLRAAQKYRPGGWAKKGATVQDLKLALQNDMPVVFWHVGPKHDKEKLEYYSPDGQKILFVQFHVKALIGYRVDQNNQEIWTFNDPIYGRIERTTEQMLHEWGQYGYRMVAVG